MIEISYLPDRKEHRLVSQLLLPRPRSEVFPFFADAHNLEAITPPLLRFRLVERGPIEMKVGRLIDYRLRIHGVPVAWRSHIPLWNPPYAFIDEQVKGPYLKWHHKHRFEEVEGGTMVHDIVHYKPPGGRLVNRLLIERDVRRIFTYRSEVLRRKFAAQR